MSVSRSTVQAGVQLGCSADHVRLLIEAGELPAANIGLGTRRARWAIRQDAIDAFLERRSASKPIRRVTKTKRLQRSGKKWF